MSSHTRSIPSMHFNYFSNKIIYKRKVNKYKFNKANNLRKQYCTFVQILSFAKETENILALLNPLSQKS